MLLECLYTAGLDDQLHLCDYIRVFLDDVLAFKGDPYLMCAHLVKQAKTSTCDITHQFEL